MKKKHTYNKRQKLFFIIIYWWFFILKFWLQWVLSLSHIPQRIFNQSAMFKSEFLQRVFSLWCIRLKSITSCYILKKIWIYFSLKDEKHIHKNISISSNFHRPSHSWLTNICCIRCRCRVMQGSAEPALHPSFLPNLSEKHMISS